MEIQTLTPERGLSRWAPILPPVSPPTGRYVHVQKAAAQLAIEIPYEEAQTLFSDLTGVKLGSERLHTFTHRAAEGLTVLDVAPSRDDIARRIEEMTTRG